MSEKIKILGSSCKPEFEKTINAYLKKGWRIRGDMVKYGDSLTIMIIKN
jgi:hypothetical protein